MKLLTKLNIRYILYSVVVMIISGMAFYFVLSLLINHQLDEQLTDNSKMVQKQLEKNPESLFYLPFAEVHKVENRNETVNFSDTLIFNEEEKEFVEYRQITEITNMNGDFYSITIRKSKLETDDLLETIAMLFVLTLILLTSILVIVNRKVAKSVWQPFYKNLKIIEEFSVTKKNPISLSKTGIVEFDKLNSVLESLTKKIVADFKNQKQFSEDVSHELQTPLSIISLKLETLLSENKLNKHQTEELKIVSSSVRRLSKLNRELILLSKIENKQFSPSENLNLTQVIREKLDDFHELIQLKKLVLNPDLVENFIVPINPALADILINNLLSNAINHNIENGKIRIESRANSLLFCNSGTKRISSPEKLFHRFYKEEPASKSVGLGLAIVKKVCDSHSLDIQYSFKDSFHCFSIRAKA